MKKEEPTARSRAFARAIKGAMTESGKKRAQVIASINYSARTFDRITSGDLIPSIEQVWSITDVLGVDPGTLFARALGLLADPVDTQLRQAGLTEDEIESIRRARLGESDS